MLGGGNFTFSANGTFVYLAGTEQQSRTISWVERSGRKQSLHATPGVYFTPRFSPDGKRLAFAVGSGNGSNLWVKDLDRDAPLRLSFLDGENRWPVWTPDSKNIVFKSVGSKPGLYWIRADGAGEVQRLTDGKLDESPYSISPDGKRLAFRQVGNGGSQDIFTSAIEGDPAHPKLGKPDLFLGTPFLEVEPAFSPDGRWLAYVSMESGQVEVYVRPFRGPGSRWQISSGGGFYPVWSRDGHELLYQSLDNRVMAVSYTAKGDAFTPRNAAAWPEAHVMYLGGASAMWDLAPDGKRLMMILPQGDENQKLPTHLTFLLNFFDELQRRGTGQGK